MSRTAKPGLHPRNPHRDGYDFPRLIAAAPDLAAYVATGPHGAPTIDFADPRAVRALNCALLLAHHGLRAWDLPEGWLCPPVPGRADYVHHLADLMAVRGDVPRGPAVRILDIGTGASAIYPILGHAAYGWSFVGTDTDPRALASAQRILDANPEIARAVELRRQHDGARILDGVVTGSETFAASLCNPPFHASREEAEAGSLRKWRNLGRAPARGSRPALNFGGQPQELWTPGGESAFVRRLIAESAERPQLCRWFTTLVSRAESLPGLQSALRRAHARTVRTIDMAQGQKKSRILAWSF